MERKYKVFVSSTIDDLKESRQRIINTVVRSGHIPVAMEYFGSGLKTIPFIKDAIIDCDIFINLVGSISGSLMPDSEISFTEFEYETALECGLKVLAFVTESSSFVPNPNDENIAKFRNRILKDGTHREFFNRDNHEDLLEKFSNTFRDEVAKLDSEDKGGWIRAKHYDNIKDLAKFEIYEQNNEPFMSAINALRSRDRVVQRGAANVEIKKILASVFWRIFGTPIFYRSNIDSIFMESGSTVNYITLGLANYHEEERLERLFYEHKKNITLLTNCIINCGNILSSRTLFPHVKGPIIWPPPPFSDEYSSTIGILDYLPKDNASRFNHYPTDLLIDECKIIEKLKAQSEEKLPSSRSLILTGMTKWDLSVGPIAQSYYGTIFKRFLFDQDIPTVMFIDSDKWGMKREANLDYPVFFDSDWREKIISLPRAVVFATHKKEDYEHFLNNFKDMGFESNEAGLHKAGKYQHLETEIYFCAVANQKFMDQVPTVIFQPER